MTKKADAEKAHAHGHVSAANDPAVRAKVQAAVADWNAQGDAEFEANPEAPIAMEPSDMTKLHQGLIDHLADAESKGEPADLQVDGDHDDAPWQPVLTKLKERCIAEMTGPDAHILVVAGAPPGPTPLSLAMTQSIDVDKSLHGAINGTKPDSPKAVKLRELIFAGRPTPKSKAGWESEWETRIAVVEKNKDTLPKAVLNLLQPMKDAHRAMVEAPSMQRRTTLDHWDWSAGVKKAVLASGAAVDGFASWIHGVRDLPQARKDQFQAILFGRRLGEKQKPAPVQPGPDVPPTKPTDPPKT